MEKEVLNKYNHWLKCLKNIDNNDYEKLTSITNEDEVNELFYKDLEFGTGGLRGVMEVGSNRFNKYNVYKATRGLGNYLLTKFSNPSVVIGYDSRNNSSYFAKIAANVLSKLKIKVFLFSELVPTPVVSYAIRFLKCDAGIIITASHNPREYNGYKVYNNEGGQITLDEANLILNEINKIDPLIDFKEFTSSNDSNINYIYDEVMHNFIESTLKTSILKDFSNKPVRIVYTPLNGAGLKPVLETLKSAGFHDIYVPKEQEKPDGNFPTCPSPNPELRETLKLGIEECEKVDSDLLIATDPDSDRCGIGIKHNNEFILLSGNEVATLLLKFLIENTKDVKGKEIVRSIVSTSIVDKIAKDYSIEVKKVLTGFKFIGEEINRLEKEGKQNKYLFGFEESYGYLTNPEVRDKDAVNASLIISEMFYFYKKRNINLIDKLNEIYSQYGFYKNKLLTHNFLGAKGLELMNEIMNKLRNSSLSELSAFFNSEVIGVEDYLNSKACFNDDIKKIELPKSNVLIVYFKDDVSLAIRPSGTEPKLKCYIEAIADSNENAQNKVKYFENLFSKILGN